MTYTKMIAAVALVTGLGQSDASAQKGPAIRQLGRLERVSPDSFASVAAALSMPAGRALVNDRIALRVLLYDSTLSHATVVADTTAATSAVYGRRPATLMRYRGDTAILIDQPSLSMFVIGPTGAIVRVMAVPRAEDVQAMTIGTGFDARGRLVYLDPLGLGQGVTTLGVGDPVYVDGKPTRFARLNQHVDSAFLLRVDLATRALDTVTALRIPKLHRELKTDLQGLLTAIETRPDPLPLVDGWAMLGDGTIAVLRARDYHIDWLDPAGRWTSTPKMPFDWQRMDDTRKQTLIDSTVKSWQATFDRIMGGAGRGGGGGGGAPSGGPPAVGSLAPMLAIGARLGDLGDYAPPITTRPGAVVGDADGNVWIRTTAMVAGQPVYDIVNRRGELVDRVQLPSFRAIVGFGPGVVYMAVTDSAKVVRLERARIK